MQISKVLVDRIITEEILKVFEDVTPSELNPTIGQKINATVKLKSIREFDGSRGLINAYNFEDENGNRFTAFSQEGIPGFQNKASINEVFNIVGIIKAQQINKRNNQKETIITRVKIL